ncbi:MAG: hypothetical protein IT379_20925 [Deltaproteobacteria bacterium]|nr:hypothetical protein [Deltaproteobacteria bacterium]
MQSRRRARARAIVALVLASAVTALAVAGEARAFDVVACGGGVAYVARDGSVRLADGARRTTLLSSTELAADAAGAIPTLSCAAGHVVARVPSVVRVVAASGPRAGGGASLRRIVPPRGFIFMQSVEPSASHDGTTLALGIREDERDGPPSLLLASLATSAEPRIVALGGPAVRDAPAPPDSHSDLAFAFMGRSVLVRVLLGARSLLVDTTRAALQGEPVRLSAGAPPICLAADGLTMASASRDGTQVRAMRDTERTGRVRAPSTPVGMTRLPRGRLDPRRCVVATDGSALAAVRAVPSVGLEVVRIALRNGRARRTSGLVAPPEVRHFDPDVARVVVFGERGADVRSLVVAAPSQDTVAPAPAGWRWTDGTFASDGSRLFLVAARVRGVRTERVLYEARVPSDAPTRVDELR